MQLNSPEQNQSPSLIQQDLPSYDNRLYLQSFHEQGDNTSNSFSFHHMQNLTNPFHGTTLQQQYQRLQHLKSSIFTTRNALLNQLNLHHTNRQAIITLPNYQQGEQRIMQERLKVRELEEYNEQFRCQVRERELEQKKVECEKRVVEEVKGFEARLRASMGQSGRKGLLEQGDESKDYNQQLTKTLIQGLRKHSQSTLLKLKPYLQQSLNLIKHSNQTINNNNQLLSQRKSKFDQQIALSKKLLTQDKQRNKRYQLEDQIEDEMVFKKQMKVQEQRIKRGEGVQLNKLGGDERGDY